MKSSSIQQLSFLIGQWHTIGKVLATDDAPEVVIEGTDTYEWTLDSHFILHKVDVMMGEERMQAIEMIGVDTENQDHYFLRSFDNTGNTDEMTAVFQDGVLLISNQATRAFLTHGLESMSALWQMKNGQAEWIDWMRMEFKKW